MISVNNNKLPEDAISLANGAVDREYKIVSIAGGCGAQMRLASLGILPGQRIKLIKANKFGPMMVLVKGSKIALGRGVISKIIVCENNRHTNK